MSLRYKPEWIRLAPTPFEKFSNIVCIDDDNILIAPWISQSQQSDGLYNYNSITDQWTLSIEYPDDFQSTYHTIGYDNTSNQLLLFGRSSHILFVNVSLKQCEKYSSSIFIGDYPTISPIYNKFHIIGGARSNKHLLWSTKKPNLSSVASFVWRTAHQKHGAVVLKDKKQLLVFGGISNNSNGIVEYTDRILFRSVAKYDHKYANKSWKHFELPNKFGSVRLPEKMEGFGYILTYNEEYLILFGGINDSKEFKKKFMKTIWVLNLITMKWKKSKRKCPTEGAMRATLMSNKVDMVLIYGYVKQIELMEQLIPSDIINLITSWYSAEYVHLLDHFNGNHWKISLTDILSSIEL